MITALENIKTYLLAKYKTFDKGYANVSKPNQTELIIDSDAESFCGIADNEGNYFYLRSLKTTSYKAKKRSARVQYYDATTQCRIVAIHAQAKEEDVVQLLLNTITSQGHNVTKSDREKTRVFKDETGKPLTTNYFTLVSLDFEVTEIISGKNCTINPCDC